MFFKYVYGRIQQYPYLHIVTWGLPRRYYGLLKIFNLQIEEHPHQFLKQCSESFTAFDSPSPSTTPSVSNIKQAPFNSPDEQKYLYKVNEDEIEEEPKLAQGADGNTNPPRRFRRRPKKKPAISIKINLDDDLRSIKSKNKNLDKILAKGRQKTYLLVIEKSPSSRRDEYSLSLVNNSTAYSHPYNKLLRKNSKKKIISPSSAIHEKKSLTTSGNETLPSSYFSSENIYPPIRKIKDNFMNATSNNIREDETFTTGSITDQMVGMNSETILKKNNTKNFSVVTNEEKILKTISKGILNPDVNCQNTALTLPSHLIPYEGPTSEESPLRNWPIITQIFTRNNIEACRYYFKATTSDNDEETEDRIKKEKNEEDPGGSKIDTTTSYTYSQSTQETTTVFGVRISSELLEAPTEDKNAASGISGDSIKEEHVASSSNMTGGIGFPTKHFATLKLSNYFRENLSPISSAGNSDDPKASQELFCSTAHLQIDGEVDDSRDKNLFHNELWKITYPKHSLTDSLTNMRLLSTTPRSYESITIDSQDDGEICDIVEGDGEGVDNLEKSTVEESSKGKLIKIRKAYIVGIIIAIFVTFLLGIILFITMTDSGVIDRIMKKYVKLQVQ